MQTQVTAPMVSSSEGAILSFDVAGLRKLIREEVRIALEGFTPQTTPTTDAPKYYTREEVEQMLHVSLTTLTKWRQVGTLTPVKIGGHTLSLRGCKEGSTDDERKAVRDLRLCVLRLSTGLA